MSSTDKSGKPRKTDKPVAPRKTAKAVKQAKTAKTVMGKRFKYQGSLERGIDVFFEDGDNAWHIPVEIIEIIKAQIAERSPVLMGASRKPLVKNSVGETLYKEHGFSPQAMTYVLPLLIEAGFCTIADKRPYLITVKR